MNRGPSPKKPRHTNTPERSTAMTRTRNPYLEELNYQKAQQARYERGLRITGEQDHEYAHDIHNAITFF